MTVAIGTCWTCGNFLKATGKRGNGRQRKFCNMTCNNGYKGLRDRYHKQAKVSDRVWPYGESDDPTITLVNEAIPRNLPEQIRSEACQELALAILSGDCPRDEAKARATEYVALGRKGYQYSSKSLSIELPMPGAPDQIPLKERLAQTNEWESVA